VADAAGSDVVRTRFRVVHGDITRLDVDAVVNAANTTLLGGGGVDGALHDAAGPELLEACRRIGGCPTGEARITPGFRLKARWVIHAVGPVWNGGSRGEPALLASCYEQSLRLASRHEIETIAFPAISTGAFAYPLELATDVALATTRRVSAGEGGPREIVFCCYSAEHLAVYQRKLGSGPG
jgi:O-acetyl-ADP-ribose deacetylase (regulator of RNase III)